MKAICNVPRGAGQEENQCCMWGDDTYRYMLHTLIYIRILHTHMYYIHIYTPAHTSIAYNQLYINTYCTHMHTYHDFPGPDTKDLGTAYPPTPMGPIQAADSNDSRCCCCSVAQSCPAVCDPMDCSTLGIPIPHYVPDFVQTHVH